jgi:hypothetical protein
MAVNILIWPGTSTFSPGLTPHGYYDADTVFQQEADMFAKWAATRLGYPILDVELQDIHFYSALEEATTEFSAYVNSYNIKDNLIYVQGNALDTGSDYNNKQLSKNFGNIISIATEYGTEVGTGGKVNYKTGSVIFSEGVNRLDLKKEYADIHESGSAITITKVFNNPSPASTRYLLPLAYQHLVNDSFGYTNQGLMSSYLMMPLHGDILRMQSIEFNDQIRRSQYSFQLRDNILTIFPIPKESRYILFEYFVDKERNNPLKDSSLKISDYSNVPYGNKSYRYINSVGRQWIKKYALAIVMETLANIRGKYSSIPIPESDVTLNSGDLLSTAENMKSNLVDELKDMLESLTTKNLMESEQQKSDYLNNTLRYMPSKIYIG